MKAFLFLCLLICVIFFSCSKDKTPALITFSYKVNGELFTQDAELSRYSLTKRDTTISLGHTFYFNKDYYENPEWGFRNSFNISYIGKTYSKQILLPPIRIDGKVSNTNSGYAYMQKGGEAPCMIFEPDSTNRYQNFVQITTANADFTNVQGVFQETLIKTYDCPDYDVADTLHITEGKFHFVLE